MVPASLLIVIRPVHTTMTLTKNVQHCHRCLRVSKRHYTRAESAQAAASATTATPTASESAPTNIGNSSSSSSIMAHLRTLTSTQLRALNQFSKQVVRTAYEQGLTIVVNKEWIRTSQHFPTLTGIEQPGHSKKQDVETQRETVMKEVIKTERVKATATQPEAAETEPAVQTLREPEITKDSASSSEGISTPPTSSYFPQVFSNIMSNFSTASKQDAVTQAQKIIPQWKLQKSTLVSKDAVLTRTRHILLSLAMAETVQSRMKRTDDLIFHLQQYPQSKSLAVKNGAISTLLRIKRNAEDLDSQALLREALAMLGHVDTLNSRGIRILAMDGGGTRGLLVIEQLRKLEQLTGRRVCELFDFICGVSTGAIMAMLFGPHKKNLEDCAAMYREISVRIFSQNAFWGTGNLLWSHSYYDTALWEQILQQYIGSVPLIKTSRDPECPKVAAVSAVVNQSRVKPYVFRNYELPCGIPALYTGSSKHQLWQAVRASAAAPGYFEEFRLGDVLHQDGGILVNNPTAIAIHEAKLLWPGEPLQCVVSFGTGRDHPTVEVADVGHYIPSNGDSYSSWKTKFDKILASATDTEAVHSMLHDLLPNDVYYRFNPYVNEVANMSETRPEKLEQLTQDAVMYTRRNEDKFEQVAATLTQPRTILQKGQDWIKLQTALLKNE